MPDNYFLICKFKNQQKRKKRKKKRKKKKKKRKKKEKKRPVCSKIRIAIGDIFTEHQSI